MYRLAESSGYFFERCRDQMRCSEAGSRSPRSDSRPNSSSKSPYKCTNMNISMRLTYLSAVSLFGPIAPFISIEVSPADLVGGIGDSLIRPVRFSSLLRVSESLVSNLTFYSDATFFKVVLFFFISTITLSKV